MGKAKNALGPTTGFIARCLPTRPCQVVARQAPCVVQTPIDELTASGPGHQ